MVIAEGMPPLMNAIKMVPPTRAGLIAVLFVPMHAPLATPPLNQQLDQAFRVRACLRFFFKQHSLRFLSGCSCSSLPLTTLLYRSLSLDLLAAGKIYTIARYYNSNARMSTLLTSIATELVARCRAHLVQRQSDAFLWEDDPTALVERLEQCRRVKDAFIEAFEATKTEVSMRLASFPLSWHAS